MKRTIAIGDIHGCVEEFAQLVKEVEYKRGEDRLLLLGDLIDRGPDPAGVVRLAQELDAESVLGNHEEKALRWRRHEQRRKAEPERYANPMTSVQEARMKEWNSIPDEHWEWVNSWPVYTRINEQWAAVHGGCVPGISLDKQKPNELMRMRYVKVTGLPSGDTKFRMASLSETGEAPLPSATNESIHHWTELWNGPENIVYGHYTRDDILVTDNGIGVLTLGLDSGCVHGGTLSAAIFTDGGYTTHQVKAKQTYVKRGPWNETME